MNMWCSDWCTGEFTPSSFGFGHCRPELTTTAQWRWPPIVYVLWRWFAVFLHVTWHIVSGTTWISDYTGRYAWLIHFTKYTYLLLSIDLICEALSSLFWYIRQQNPKNNLPTTTTWYMKLAWLMYEMTMSVSLAVCTLSWILFYSPNSQDANIDLQTQGLIMLYMVLNISITAMPVRIYHVIYPMIFGVVCLIFTAKHHCTSDESSTAGDVHVCNNFQDMSDPEIYVIRASMLALVTKSIPVSHLLIYGLHLIRVVLSEQCFIGHSPAAVIYNANGEESLERPKTEGKTEVAFDTD